MKISTICVVGGGLMGRQIALCASIHGYEARVYDKVAEVCDKVREWSEGYLAERIVKGRMTTEEVEKAKSLFHVEKDLRKAVSGADCVIEAIVEVEDVKRAFFKELDPLVASDVIIATNSSYMVSSKFADCVSQPQRLANMHFYNPALVMKFVEVVQGPHTSEECARTLYQFAKSLGKTPVWMKKEIDGFLANRILAAIYDEVYFLVENGYCDYLDVDNACENGLGHPMGPFRLNDLTGIDLSLDIMKRRYKETGKKPNCYDLYEGMVRQGRLGRKSGKGFYEYH
jgi:3-hydroxybutyryl-CoA dehydrogenase